MNIVFFGSSHFAVASLKSLLKSSHEISCVVTQPDRKKGRGLHLGATAVKTLAEGAHLNIYQPQRINTREAVEYLKSLRPDLFVVIAYGQILSQEVLELPKIFSINAHASLLPRYRGAAPINWAIINGEKTTGVTIIKMAREMDAGPIILQKSENINEDDTAITLEERLGDMAAHLLVESVDLIEKNKCNLTPQDEERVSFAPKLKKEHGNIIWKKSALDIYDLIRGCLPWPGVFTYYKGKLLKIYRASVIRLPGFPASRLPAEIIEVSSRGIIVATGKENLMIEELQLEGKRVMQAKEFILGHQICVGERLG